MTDFTVIEAKPYHCGQMIRILRHEHQAALSSIGVDAHRELRMQFEASCFRRAWLIDGKLAALGGVVGSPLSALGFVWLALSERARKYPIQIIKEGRRQLNEIMLTRHELATTILSEDKAARRLAIFLGFHVSDDGLGSPAHTRLARRSLARFLDINPDSRIPIKDGYVIAMGYHAEGAA